MLRYVLQNSCFQLWTIHQQPAVLGKAELFHRYFPRILIIVEYTYFVEQHSVMASVDREMVGLGQKNLKNGKTKFLNLLILEHLRKIILHNP